MARIPALFFLVLFICTTSVSSLYLEVFPTGLWKVPEDLEHNLNVSLRFNVSDVLVPLDDPEALLVVTAVPDEDWKLHFVDSSVIFTAEEVNEGVFKNITFSGYYWGFTQVSFYLTRNDLVPDFNNWTLLRDDLEIVIDRGSLVVDIIFISIGSVFVLINNINMGAQLNIEVILQVLKRPLGPLCGFLSQFIFMPMLTWIMANYLFDDPLHKLGLFTYGCSPGGTNSNFWTLMFDGDINLSITMTAVSTIAAMGMMPLWMFTLGSSLSEENNNLQIPFANLAISLALLTIPVGIGILIRLKKPQLAERGKKIIKPFSFFILLFFMSVGTYNSYKVVLMMTWQMVLAGALVMLCGYTLGALLAKLMCLANKEVIAVSIETALQNPGVAFILLKLSLGSPYSDLASIPIIATLFISGPPLIFVYLLCQAAKKFCGCCPEDLPNKNSTEGEEASSPEETSFLQVGGEIHKTNQEM